MSDTLRSATIRLAFYNPELRGELLPLLVKYAAEDKVRAVNNDGKVVWVKKDTLRDQPGKFKPVKEEKGDKKEKGAPAGSPKPKELQDMLRSLREEHELPNVGDDPVSAIRAINRFMEDPSFKDQGYDDWEKELRRVKSELAKHIPKKTKKTKTAPTRERVTKKAATDPTLRTATIRLAYENPNLRPHLLPLLARTAAADPMHKVKDTYQRGLKDIKALRDGIAKMKHDSKFHALKARRELDDALESIDMLAKAKSMEDYAKHTKKLYRLLSDAQMLEEKTGALDSLTTLDDVRKGMKVLQHFAEHP